MEIPSDAPEPLKIILEKMKEKISKNPLEGKYIIIGENGNLERKEKIRRSSFISSALIEINNIKEILDTLDIPGNIFHSFGSPAYGESGGVVFYEPEDIPEKYKDKLDVLVIEQLDPKGGVNFLIRQDIILFYDLFLDFISSKIVYNDHIRGQNSIIEISNDLGLYNIKILKNYLLDYLTIRKKALLIGYYYLVDINIDNELKGFPKKYSDKGDYYKWDLYISVDRYIKESLFAQLNMYLVILPPEKRLLDDFSFMAEPPSIKINTNKGIIEITKSSKYDQVNYFTNAFFKSEVLQKYEGDLRYIIDDDGGIRYYGIWAVSRGIYRVGDDYLYANISDLFGSLPYDEWQYWASYNTEPLSIEEHKEYNKVIPIQKLINKIMNEMEYFATRQKYEYYKIGLSFDHIYQLRDEDITNICNKLKKVFLKTYNKENFLNYISDLYKIVIDSIDKKECSKYIDIFNPDYKINKKGEIFGSLNLFYNVIILENILKTCEIYYRNRLQQIDNTKKYYEKIINNIFNPEENEIARDINEQLKEVEDAFSIFYCIYAFRSKGGGAHTGSDEEFKKTLKILGFPDTQSEYRSVYRKILEKLIYFYISF